VDYAPYSMQRDPMHALQIKMVGGMWCDHMNHALIIAFLHIDSSSDALTLRTQSVNAYALSSFTLFLSTTLLLIPTLQKHFNFFLLFKSLLIRLSGAGS